MLFIECGLFWNDSSRLQLLQAVAGSSSHPSKLRRCWMSGETFLFSENQHLLWPVGSRSWTGVPAGKMAQIAVFGGVFFNEWSK